MEYEKTLQITFI